MERDVCVQHLCRKVGLGGDGPHLSFPCFFPDGRALAKLYVWKDRGEGMGQGIQEPEKAIEKCI